MGLKLPTNFKGITAEYWCIHDVESHKLNNKTTVTMRLYVNKSVRDEDINNYLPSIQDVMTIDGIDYTLAQLYSKRKESVLVDGVEVNRFVDAEDC